MAKQKERTWNHSPLAGICEIPASHMLSEGPVRFLLVSGARDDTSWGIVGAIWMQLEGDEGGYLVSPDALWSGSEMARNYKNAKARGWTPKRIFEYWDSQTGASGEFMIDAEQEVDALFQVARRVGTL